MANPLASPALADLRRRAHDRARQSLQRRVQRPPAQQTAREPAPQREIANLKRSHQQLEEKVAALQQQADLSFIDVIERLAQLRGQVRSAVTRSQAAVVRSQAAVARSQTAVVRSQAARVTQARTARAVKTLALRRTQELRALKVNDRVQTMSAAVNSAQTAAYGQKGSVFARNNLLLAGNQLLWTFAEPLLRSTGFVSPTTATLVARLAPVGMLLTGAAALGNRQHVRFLSGVVRFDTDQLLATVRLEHLVASALWPAFARRTDIPVTVTPIGAGTAADFTGSVIRGTLVIRATDDDVTSEGPVSVAWMVDTGADVG